MSHSLAEMAGTRTAEGIIYRKEGRNEIGAILPGKSGPEPYSLSFSLALCSIFRGQSSFLQPGASAAKVNETGLRCFHEV
jgi:hypothetical protein